MFIFTKYPILGIYFDTIYVRVLILAGMPPLVQRVSYLVINGKVRWLAKQRPTTRSSVSSYHMKYHVFNWYCFLLQTHRNCPFLAKTVSWQFVDFKLILWQFVDFVASSWMNSTWWQERLCHGQNSSETNHIYFLEASTNNWSFNAASFFRNTVLLSHIQILIQIFSWKSLVVVNSHSMMGFTRQRI